MTLSFCRAKPARRSTIWDATFRVAVMPRMVSSENTSLAQWQAASAAGSGSQALFSTVITGSLVSVLPLMAAFLFLQRYWQSGLGSGAVKA